MHTYKPCLKNRLKCNQQDPIVVDTPWSTRCMHKKRGVVVCTYPVIHTCYTYISYLTTYLITLCFRLYIYTLVQWRASRTIQRQQKDIRWSAQPYAHMHIRLHSHITHHTSLHKTYFIHPNYILTFTHQFTHPHTHCNTHTSISLGKKNLQIYTYGTLYNTAVLAFWHTYTHYIHW